MKPAIVTDVRVDDERITFALSDGRVVSAPTSWSARLSAATTTERADWRIDSGGTVVEWPSIDEHVGVWTLLGIPEEDVLESAGFVIERPVSA